jgi:hypothetical protein
MTDVASEKSIFLHAAGLAPADRGAYLADACGSDAALRGRVDGLEHGPEIAPAGLRQLHVALDGKPVDPLCLRDLFGAFGERAGEVAAGEIKA